MHTPDPAPARRRLLLTLALAPLAAAWASPARAAEFDHQHAAWTALLRRHVVLRDGGKASRVRYAGFAADHEALRAYLAALAAVPRAELDGWAKPQRMAFLINAYNAYTVELILTRYPKLGSIKDIGTLLTSPWKQKVAPLFGRTLTLDSIGCPMLREEAFVAERLDAQLDEQAQRFLADRSRNRFDAQGRKLLVSKIFDWYGEDFRLGHRGITSLPAFLARHAELLADAPADRDVVRGAALPIDFLDYDWALNDTK